MRHFPVFLAVAGRRIVVSGAGETALAKVRLLLKTDATVNVFGTAPVAAMDALAAAGRIVLHRRPVEHGDLICAALVYGANDDPDEDARVVALGRHYGALTNIVDNLADSAFITPAIVDRDPVTVAIGTEGAAPVLARRIKQANEEQLPASLGVLARYGQEFRPQVDALPPGRPRRAFWTAYYDQAGPQTLAQKGPDGLPEALTTLLEQAKSAQAEDGAPTETDGIVHIIGAGPGDPELLTLKARRLLHEADVVVHDRLVSSAVLELARREATLIDVGKTPYGPAVTQAEINAQCIAHARGGAVVARLKSGDPSVFGRLDEELDAFTAAGVSYTIVPGITAASAAAAGMGTSLTRRGRNSALQILTAHDVAGFADHDWRALAAPGATAAIYMGVRAARFFSGRLLMHSAAAQTPVTVVENASRLEQRTVATTLGALADDIAALQITGPAVIFIGLRPRDAVHAATATIQQMDHV
ncbi:MAG: siroheme synthase CysG, partial [Pseudomonadota bacterium]